MRAEKWCPNSFTPRSDIGILFLIEDAPPYLRYAVFRLHLLPIKILFHIQVSSVLPPYIETMFRDSSLQTLIAGVIEYRPFSNHCDGEMHSTV